MDLESSNNCTKDAVEVFDGVDDAAPLVGRFCGNTVPTALTSQGSALFVKFRSDYVGQMSGFRATYTKESSGRV